MLFARMLRSNGIRSLKKTTTSCPSQTRMVAARHARFNSSISEAQAQNQPTEGNASPARCTYTRGRTRQLEKVLGEERTMEMKKQSKDLRLLRNELRQIYNSQRSLSMLLKGPYRVVLRNDITGSHAEVELEENMIKVGAQSIPYIWLRDNCQCKSCVHEATKQRLLDTFAIPADISIKSSSEHKKSISVEWSDGHKSNYSKDFLLNATRSYEHRATVRQGLINMDLWGAEIAEKPPRVNYSDKEDEGDITSILKSIRRYGFCYVDQLPATPEATEALLRRISFIRETHYGGFYDFTADLASKDTAYTNIALDAHTDTTYFSDPAGLQAFHLLEHSDGEGGASLLVDGFHAANQLLQQDPEAYKILATVNVHGHASGNEGISIQPYRGFPVLQHDQATGALIQVRWNSSDRSSIELPVSEVEKWYDAARKFDALLKKKENEYWEQLKPGTVLIFDNWRVMHGRSAFTGKRRICGGYINRDDWISKFKMLHFGKDEVLGKLAAG